MSYCPHVSHIPSICLTTFTSVSPIQPRCLDHAKFFPPDKPVWCTEKSEHPFYELKCCDTSMCNTDLILSVPAGGRGELHRRSRSSCPHPNRSHSNHRLSCQNTSQCFVPCLHTDFQRPTGPFVARLTKPIATPLLDPYHKSIIILDVFLFASSRSVN